MYVLILVISWAAVVLGFLNYGHAIFAFIVAVLPFIGGFTIEDR